MKNYARLTIFVLLMLLISSSAYIVKKYLFPTAPYVFNSDPPKSIFTGELLSNKIYNARLATYFPAENSYTLCGISDADILFEFINSKGKLSYNAIFHDHLPVKISPVAEIKDGYPKSMPKFNFSEDANQINNLSKSAQSIFVTLNSTLTSNFVFSEGKYYHYRDILKEIDKNNNEHVAVSNIIIQFVEKSSLVNGIDSVNGEGTGLLFMNGKGIEIRWNRKGDNPIKITDENLSDISLLPGHIWWIIMDDANSVTYK